MDKTLREGGFKCEVRCCSSSQDESCGAVRGDLPFGTLSLEARFVRVGVENCFHLQPALGLCGADQIHDRLIADQRLPFPVRLINENSRCSILFHLLVPGG